MGALHGCLYRIYWGLGRLSLSEDTLCILVFLLFSSWMTSCLPYAMFMLQSVSIIFYFLSNNQYMDGLLCIPQILVQ